MMLSVTLENENSLREDFQICVRQVNKGNWKLKQRDYNPNNACCNLNYIAYFFALTAHIIMNYCLLISNMM